MSRLDSILVRRGLALVLVAGVSSSFACSSVTTVTSEFPLQVQAKPPAPPQPDLPPVPQPPPPPRVTVEGDVVVLDEALTFDDAGALSPDHADILGELAKWMAKTDDVLELSVEAQSVGAGGKAKHRKLSKALAQQVVDALVAEGIEAERLLAVGAGKSEDEQRHVLLRITKREDEGITIAPQ